MKIRILTAFGMGLVLLFSLLFLPHVAISVCFIIVGALALYELGAAMKYSDPIDSNHYWVEFVMLLFSCAAVIVVFDNYLMGYLIILCALVDVGGFTTGKLLGKKAHRVASLKNISPNKSWEGYIVGVICSVGLGIVFFKVLETHFPAKAFWFCLFAWIPSIIGDLYESALKRRLHVKDSADRVLNGKNKLMKLLEAPVKSHGGYLDRIDSFIFVSVAYVIFNSIWQ